MLIKLIFNAVEIATNKNYKEKKKRSRCICFLVHPVSRCCVHNFKGVREQLLVSCFLDGRSGRSLIFLFSEVKESGKALSTSGESSLCDPSRCQRVAQRKDWHC